MIERNAFYDKYIFEFIILALQFYYCLSLKLCKQLNSFLMEDK